MKSENAITKRGIITANIANTPLLPRDALMEISNRLMNIDIDEMEFLTNETRKILLWAYLSRRLRPPFWIVAPRTPPNRTGEATSAPASRLGTIALLAQI